MYLKIKRFLDLFCATVACIVLLPIFVPLAIILLLTGEHYIFYFQERVGKNNNLFNIVKFATMLKNSPNIGTGIITLRNDPRLLPLGGFLRKTKINELPQLINVILGTMSVVGPRPLLQTSFNRYAPNVKENIYNVRPGITGIGSLVFRDEEMLLTKAANANDTYGSILMYKGELEMWYLKNISFSTDIKIIFLTFWSIFSPNKNLANTFFKDLPKRNF
jgi:lipopolysaccharide/colanic/teichoic acid biosynthesis glycosyltransferase